MLFGPCSQTLTFLSRCLQEQISSNMNSEARVNGLAGQVENLTVSGKQQDLTTTIRPCP